MSRDLTTAVNTALTAQAVTPFFAVDLLFDNPNQVYLWTGRGTRTISGKPYIGGGSLLSVSVIEETTEIAAKGATITLSGVPTELIALALAEPYQGRVCNIFFGVLDDLSTYTELFSGYMDKMEVDEGPETGSIELQVENRLVDLERPRVRKYTSASQKAEFAGDKGFDFIAGIQDQKLPWGDGNLGNGRRSVTTADIVRGSGR